MGGGGNSSLSAVVRQSKCQKSIWELNQLNMAVRVLRRILDCTARERLGITSSGAIPIEAAASAISSSSSSR